MTLVEDFCIFGFSFPIENYKFFLDVFKDGTAQTLRFFLLMQEGNSTRSVCETRATCLEFDRNEQKP